MTELSQFNIDNLELLLNEHSFCNTVPVPIMVLGVLLNFYKDNINETKRIADLEAELKEYQNAADDCDELRIRIEELESTLKHTERRLEEAEAEIDED